ncbi:MAG: hypothetical protein ACK4S4_04075 [Pyrinomonadaceae bacterium]
MRRSAPEGRGGIWFLVVGLERQAPDHRPPLAVGAFKQQPDRSPFG